MQFSKNIFFGFSICINFSFKILNTKQMQTLRMSSFNASDIWYQNSGRARIVFAAHDGTKENHAPL